MCLALCSNAGKVSKRRVEQCFVLMQKSVSQSSHIVVGIEDPGYVLCEVLIQHRFDVVPVVD